MPYRPAQIWTGSAWDDIGDARVGVQPINTQTANYTLVLGDIATRVQMNSTSARTITIPPNSSVAFPVGTRLDIANINTGVLTIAGGSGVTVNGRALTLGQWETATVVQRAANAWVVEPQANLTAALGSKLDVSAYNPKILQVVSTTKNDTFSTTSTSFVDITGLSISITPSINTSKILVFANLNVGSSGSVDVAFRMMRDATEISTGTGGTNNLSMIAQLPTNTLMINPSVAHLDFPNVNTSLSYKIQMRVPSGTGFINRRGADTFYVLVSSITAMEVTA